METPNEVRAENCGECMFWDEWSPKRTTTEVGTCMRYPVETAKYKGECCGEGRKEAGEEQADKRKPNGETANEAWMRAAIERVREVLVEFGVEKPEMANPIDVLLEDYRRLWAENTRVFGKEGAAKPVREAVEA